MGKLKIVVLTTVCSSTRARAGAVRRDKSPVVRTLDKKEVEEEVAEALAKLGHEPRCTSSMARRRACSALARLDCDLVFNLTESFADDDTADFKIAGVPGADREAIHRLGHPRPDAGAGQGDREEDLRVPRHPHPGVRQVASAAGSISPTTSSFRSSSSRRARTARSASSSAPWSIRFAS